MDGVDTNEGFDCGGFVVFIAKAMVVVVVVVVVVTFADGFHPYCVFLCTSAMMG
jgi:hypothetical protein